MKGKGTKTMAHTIKEAEALSNRGPRRFWLKPHTDTVIVFVDDDAPQIMEHQVRANGRWDNFATCPGPECPVCAAGDTPYLVAFWTIIDRTQYVGKDDKTYKDQVRLFAAKQKVMEKLRRRSEELIAGGYAKGLQGIVVQVFRGDDKTPGSGDDFTIKAQAAPELLIGPDGKLIKPFDYEAILAPNEARLAQFARIVSAGGGKGVPF
jgi:hypothetical protein